MSITIESSDNRDYFKKSGWARFSDFYMRYIPKHLPEWGTPDEDGIDRNWTASVEGYVSIIDFSVGDAIDAIIERPENGVVEFQLKALRTTIDLWTPEWNKEFSILALNQFHSFGAHRTSDAYMTLWEMAYMGEGKPNETSSINKNDLTFYWTHNSKRLESVLDSFQPLIYLFEEKSLEGFIMALSGTEAGSIPYGCIKASNGNKTYVSYLFYRLIKAGYISTFRGVDRDALWEHLIGQSSIRKFRQYYSDFENNSVTLKEAKTNLIDQVLEFL